jgi:ketosteroid isomerase-like protein
MKALLVACVVVVASPALADKPAAKPVAAPATPELGQLLPPDGDPSGAAFAFAGSGVYAGATAQQMKTDLPALHVMKNVAGAFSKNKKSYWASADVASGKSQEVDGHASAVWDKTATGWKLVAFSLVPTATAKQQQDAKKKGAVAPAIKASNGAGDEYFLTVFDKVFRENAGETVGARKDAVMFGSAANERYVGAASIKKTLASWDLAFTVHGDMADGKTSGRLLWIAANIDARPQTKPKAEPTPYRVFLVYEGDADGNYELVHASFAAVTSGWPP